MFESGKSRTSGRGAVTLCGCGKPKSHGGMCPVRRAVRKANNGPSGRAKVPAANRQMSEEAIARRLFGDMADDILLLRERGHTVARFKDGFRVDRDVLTADALCARAKVLRERPTKLEIRKPARVDVAGERMGGAASTSAPPAAIQGGRDAPSVENAREGRNGGANGRGSPSNQGPPAVADAPDLTARMSRLEQRVEFLFAVVAEAIAGRRETLLEQASGLAKLATELRDAA